jgi:hypothetical protein
MADSDPRRCGCETPKSGAAGTAHSPSIHHALALPVVRPSAAAASRPFQPSRLRPSERVLPPCPQSTRAQAGTFAGHDHQALCVRDGAAAEGEHSISLRCAFLPAVSRASLPPHGAPGSDDALQAGAPSMPALLHHTLHLPQLPRCHPPISLSLRVLVGLSVVLSVPCMRKGTPFSLRQRLARPIGPPYGDPSVTVRPVLWGRQPLFEPHLISSAISVFRYGLAVFRSI